MAVAAEANLRLEPSGFDRRVHRFWGYVTVQGDGTGGYNELTLKLDSAYIVGKPWQWCITHLDLDTDYSATATYGEVIWYTGQYWQSGTQLIYKCNLGQLQGGNFLMIVGTYKIPWIKVVTKPNPSIGSLTLGVKAYVTNVNTIYSRLQAQGYIFEEPIMMPNSIV